MVTCPTGAGEKIGSVEKYIITVSGSHHRLGEPDEHDAPAFCFQGRYPIQCKCEGGHRRGAYSLVRSRFMDYPRTNHPGPVLFYQCLGRLGDCDGSCVLEVSTTGVIEYTLRETLGCVSVLQPSSVLI